MLLPGIYLRGACLCDHWQFPVSLFVKRYFQACSQIQPRFAAFGRGCALSVALPVKNVLSHSEVTSGHITGMASSSSSSPFCPRAAGIPDVAEGGVGSDSGGHFP